MEKPKKYLVRTWTVTDLGRTPYGTRDVCETDSLWWGSIKGRWAAWLRQNDYPTGDDWMETIVNWEIVRNEED